MGGIDPIEFTLALDDGESRRGGMGPLSGLRSGAPSIRTRLAAALRAAQDGLDDAVVISDTETHQVVYASDGAARMLERPREDVVGSDPADLLAEEERDALRERLRMRSAGHDLAPRYECTLLSASGRRIPVEASTAPVPTDPGLLVTVLRDVRAQRAQRERAEAGDAVLDALLHGSSELLVVVDRRGVVHRFNPAAERVLGISAAEAVGRTLEELGILEASATDRRVVWTPVTAGAGDWIVWRGEDVTEREHAERELTRLRLAETSDSEGRTSTGRLVSTLAHDLREPARVTGGFAALLGDHYADRLDERGQRMLTAIREAAANMSDLLDDLSAYGRADREPRPAPVDLRDVMRAVRDRLGEDIRVAEARIDYEDLPTVLADPAGVEQVMGRLVENAIKFRNGHPTRIEVAATRLPDGWQVDVRDNGIGIAPRDRERVFELFCRLHPREDYDGTGAGLAICKRIVERHGGSMWVGDSPGHGATLCFTIPDPPPSASL